MSGARGWAAALLLFTCIARPGPASAVDRQLGADVPKPAARGVAWSAASVSRLDADLNALLDGAATLRGAHVGLLALDTGSGAVLYARNADDAFVPASTLKLLTGSVALLTLGAQFRFRTQAFADASGSTLYVRGGGDPLLSAADLNDLARAVRAGGATTLANGVRIDASAFEATPYPPGWSLDDVPYDYAPVLSAASVEENALHLTVAPNRAPGLPLAVSGAPAPFALAGGGPVRSGDVPLDGCPFTRAIVVIVRATTAARGAGAAGVDLDRAPGGCIVVTGSLPLGSEPQTIDAAVPSPIWYLRALTEYALAQSGVRVAEPEAAASGPAESADGAGPVPGDARIVWTHDGEALADLLADMWWPSDNLVAESLLDEIGLHEHGEPGTRDHGADAERAWLTRIGIDPATVTLADGSGLSVYDRITPRALAAILQADWNGPERDLVLDDLPLAGVRGTLAKSFVGTPAERRVFAKTGSVNHARGLAGYLAPLHHGAITFAWSIDDWLGNDDDLAALRARILARLIGD